MFSMSDTNSSSLHLAGHLIVAETRQNNCKRRRLSYRSIPRTEEVGDTSIQSKPGVCAFLPGGVCFPCVLRWVMRGCNSLVRPRVVRCTLVEEYCDEAKHLFSESRRGMSFSLWVLQDFAEKLVLAKSLEWKKNCCGMRSMLLCVCVKLSAVQGGCSILPAPHHNKKSETNKWRLVHLPHS